MSSRRILVRAPSNIALIKYMGKSDVSLNLPLNSSLSMTLSDLCTWAELIVEDSEKFELEIAESILDLGPTRSTMQKRLLQNAWSETDRTKALKHAARVRSQMGADSLKGKWILKTNNTFPAGAGIASSASSFAAMTLAFAAACSKDAYQFSREWRQDSEFIHRLTDLSRLGSGSSCRSFQGPWVLWNPDRVAVLPYPAPFVDLVVVVDQGKKSVSSSDAHLRVLDSPLWLGRPERVSKRVSALRIALEKNDLHAISAIAWAEALEMHGLFHTSKEPFSYWKPETLKVLNWLEESKTSSSAEPPAVVTLDAGANVHVLVTQEYAEAWKDRIKQKFPEFKILEDRPGTGAEIVEVQEGVY